jgi:hypothetical protein
MMGNKIYWKSFYIKYDYLTVSFTDYLYNFTDYLYNFTDYLYNFTDYLYNMLFFFLQTVAYSILWDLKFLLRYVWLEISFRF